MTDPSSYPGTPRWVKVSVIVTVTLFLLLGVVALTDVGGEHGPGRHFRKGDTPNIERGAS